MNLLLRSIFISILLGAVSCSHGNGNSFDFSNSGGTEPRDDKEALKYRRELLKCYKSGGSRIVMIQQQLVCY